LYGRLKFNPSGQIDLPQTLIQIQHGKLVSIYSAGKTLGKALYPTPAWSKR
jgi:branched-chain amino acid transport system substrate-binding protein